MHIYNLVMIHVIITLFTTCLSYEIDIIIATAKFLNNNSL